MILNLCAPRARVPDPAADSDQPGWLYKVCLPFRNVELGVPISGLVRFDVRSQRKLGGEDRLVMIFENSTLSGANAHFNAFTRVLMKHR